MAREPISLDGMEDIPDPAAALASRPPPAEAQAPAERSPTRPGQARARAAAAIVSLAWAAANVAPLGLRDDLHTPGVALTLLLWIALATAALVIALRPRLRGLPWSVRAVQGILVAIPTGFALSAALGSNLHETPGDGTTLPCMAVGAQIGLVPLALAALVLRRSFLNAPAWRGAAIGAVCGLVAALAIHAHCPYTAAMHVLISHGFPVLAGALLGAAAGALGGRV